VSVTVTQPTGTATGSTPPPRPPARSPEQIEADITATRTALVGRIETLQHRLTPASLAGAVRDRAMRVLQRDDGSLDPVRVTVVAGVGLVLVLYAVRRTRL
jgi:hypothetical protein